MVWYRWMVDVAINRVRGNIAENVAHNNINSTRNKFRYPIRDIQQNDGNQAKSAVKVIVT